MSATFATLRGTLKSDGTLDLQEKIALPAGPVQVTVVPIPDLPKDDSFWQRMEGIWAGQKARGHVARSVEEVEAEHQAMCQEWEERMKRLESIQAEARKAREKGRQPP